MIVSAAMLFGYVNPTYRSHVDASGNPDSILDLQKTVAGYTKTMNDQVAIKNKVDELTIKKNRISDDDLKNLKRLLPESVDNVRLIIEMETIVKRYSSDPSKGFKSINISKVANTTGDNSSGAIVSEGDKYNSLTINFVVSMSYENFVKFLEELESSLRLADIKSITFSANDLGSYDYNVSLKTYWLK